MSNGRRKQHSNRNDRMTCEEKIVIDLQEELRKKVLRLDLNYYFFY